MCSDDERKQLETEIQQLQQKLKEKEQKLKDLEQQRCITNNVNHSKYCAYFSPSDISRYSRQLILPSVGLAGQVRLKNAKVLIVGVGGLGCPAAQYLAAAGLGNIDILDSDEVELTNLHRQILHGFDDIGKSKVQSGYESLKRLNGNIEIVPIHTQANSDSLWQLLTEKNYNVVVDCTDNVATRYLLNDVCVMKHIPLVSGSALQMEGQLTVYNYKNSLCYRCLFPVPPPPETVTSCGDGGVLGVSVIGVLQALEVIKIILELPGVLSGRLLIFDGLDSTFRNIKLRGKNAKCAVCGENPSITKPIDYEQFCGARMHDKVENIKILTEDEEINVKRFVSIKNKTVIDVRPKLEFQMCSLPDTINFPYDDIVRGKEMDFLHNMLCNMNNDDTKEVYIICRRGNDSQRTVSLLKNKYEDLPVKLVNVTGGLHAYSKFVDHSFPVY